MVAAERQAADHGEHKSFTSDGLLRRTASAVIQPKRVMIASRNVALPHGKNKKTTKSALAARETTPIGRQLGRRAPPEPLSGARATRRNYQEERYPAHPAVPCVGIPASQHRSIDPKGGLVSAPLRAGLAG